MTKMEVFKYVLDTLAVVGTWGAVIVALKLSRGSAKKAAEDAEARAGLVAAHHLGTLRNIQAAALQISTVFGWSREAISTRPDLELPWPTGTRDHIKAIGLDVLAQMLPLPNHCASRIGKSIGELSTLLGDIDMMRSVWPAMNSEFRISWLDRWSGVAGLAAENLHSAIEECAKAASAYAPSFTAAEIGLGKLKAEAA